MFSNLHCPLGELAGVVLQLVGEAGSRLGAELLSPVHVAAVTRVPLIEGLQVDKLGLIVGSLLGSIKFTPALSHSGYAMKCFDIILISYLHTMTMLLPRSHLLYL